MKPNGPLCQSCGMPLSQDLCGGGSETDGTRSAQYCSHCYVNGKFAHPDLSSEEMSARVREKLESVGLPDQTVTKMSEAIPELDRWRSSPQ